MLQRFISDFVPARVCRFLLFTLCLAASARAQVVINEIVAANSDRLLSRAKPGYPRLGVTTPWMLPEFNDATWPTGNGPFGFGSWAGVVAGTDISAAMLGKVPTLYLRKTFNVTPEQAASATNLELVALYNDGFIAFLNGTEVARRNLGNAGMFAYHDQVALNPTTNLTASVIAVGAANTRLVPGTNWLCIQAHNRALADANASEFLLKADLRLATTTPVMFVTNTAPWKYFVGTVEPSGGVLDPGLLAGVQERVVWAALEFNDSAWAVSAGPVGIESANPPDYVLGTNLYAQVYGLTPSVYTRAIFTATTDEAASAQPLRLVLDYDDGAIVYLNGREIARRNVGTVGVPTPHDAQATSGHSANGDGGGAVNNAEVTLTLGPAYTLLTPGYNVLAVQMHNSALTSSDLIARATLSSTGAGARTLVEPSAAVRYFVGTEEPWTLNPDSDSEAELDAPDTESDWIELRNISAVSTNLTSWSLTDDPGQLRKWVFPAGSTIAPGGFLVVLATGFDVGPANGASNLHTNFKLSSNGEYLGLVDAGGAVVSQLAPAYPAQSPFHSYGRDTNGSYVFFGTATPGAANGGLSFTNLLAPPTVSPEGGFYSTVLTVELTPPAAAAQIRYTRDGSTPTETNGFAYTGPVSITGPTVLRARCFQTGAVASATVTHTYLLGQSPARRMLPAICLSGDPALTFYGPNASGGPLLGEGIFAIRAGYYVNEMWTPAGNPFVFNLAMQTGRPFEKPAALEVVSTNGTTLRRDVGLRLSGSNWSRPRYRLNDAIVSRFTPDNPYQKPSFNVFFRGDLGDRPQEVALFPDSPVTSFYDVRLRAGKNDIANPFICDELMRRMFINTGQQGSVGSFATLYINGVFKGFYNPCEHLREGFMQEHFGSSESWDVRQVWDVVSGDAVHWNGMLSFLRTNNLADTATYRRVQDWLDVDNLIDYLLVNVYGATWDWPNNNWVAARERSDRGRWRFHVWDAEGAFGYQSRSPSTHDVFIGDTNGDGVSESNQDNLRLDIGTEAKTSWRELPSIYTLLKAAPEFRLRWADRAQRHFFRGGALTRQSIEPVYVKLRDQINPIMFETIGETLNTSFFVNWIQSPVRSNTVFTQFRKYGLWPATLAPEFGPHGGALAPGSLVYITNRNAGGTIYYTTNGLDPRALGGGIVGRAYTGPIQPPFTTELKARVRGSTGEWSPLQEATFVQEQRPLILLTELMYHPLNNQSDHEFIELKNAGNQPAVLGGTRFSEGVDFAIADGTVLAPGGFLVIARTPSAFTVRYPGVACTTNGFSPSNLANSGERVTLVDVASNVLASVSYGDAAPWPTTPDGLGYSLVPRLPNANPQPDDAANWRASTFAGGSPGRDDPEPVLPAVVVNEVLSRAVDEELDWIELHNPSAASADIGGWFLTDSKGTPRKYRIPPGTSIPAGGFARFTEAQFNAAPAAPECFALSALGDEVYLYAADAAQNLLGYSHGFEFGAAAAGVSFGRHLNSIGGEKFPAQVAASPLATNGTPRFGPVVITEILYAPFGNRSEFVEIRNVGTEPQPLFDPRCPTNTWRLDGFDFDFPTNISLAPGQFAVVCGGEPAAFRSAHQLPPGVLVFGPAGGFLDNAGERVALQRPDAPVPDPATSLPLVPRIDVDVVEYDQGIKWPAPPGGMSLERVLESRFGDDPANWRIGVATNGSPARPGSLAFAAWRERCFTPTQQADPAISDLGADPDADGQANLMEYTFGTDPLVSNSVPWQFSLAQTNGQRHLCVTFRRSLEASETVVALQLSDDLETWPSGASQTVELLLRNDGDGFESLILSESAAVGQTRCRFARLRVALK
jgi:hypothetical protein